MLFNSILKAPVTQEEGLIASQSHVLVFVDFFVNLTHPSSPPLLISLPPSRRSHPPTTRSCCRLGSGWLWSVPGLPSGSPARANIQTPGWGPQWWARSCTCWRSSGRCPWPRCTQWMALRGNPPDRSRETPGTDRRPQRRLLCAAEEKLTRLNLFLSFFFYTQGLWHGSKMNLHLYIHDLKVSWSDETAKQS